jgi:O-antigen/teichoic acid export membrane protein
MFKNLNAARKDHFFFLKNSHIGSSISKGVLWTIFGSVFNQVLTLVTFYFVAKILNVKSYGEFAIVRSTIFMFTIFVGYSLGITATKCIAEFQESDKEKTGKIVGITLLVSLCAGALIALVVFLFASSIATYSFNSDNVSDELKISSIVLFFSSLNGALSGILAGFKSFNLIAKINIYTSILMIVIMPVFSFYFGLHGAMFGLCINSFVLCVINYFYVNFTLREQEVKMSFRGINSLLGILYKFTLPAMLSGILGGPVTWVCNSMLVRQPNGFEKMAIFDVAYQWRNAVLFIPVLLGQVVLPYFSSTSSDPEMFKKIFKVNIILNFLFSFIVALFISFFSGFIMKSYGKDFIEGDVLLIVLVFTTVLNSVNSVIGQAIAGTGKMWAGFYLNLIWGTTLIIATYFLLKMGYSSLGLALAYLISYIVHTLFSYIYYKNKLFVIKK